MDNCIFCMIVNGDIPSRKVYEDEYCIATLDIGPAAKGHTLIIPKTHHKDLTEMDEALLGKVMMAAKTVGQRQLKKLGAAGFNVVQNNGAAAGQSVLHYHVHVIPRYEGGPAMVADWAPGSPSGEELDEVMNTLRED